ncbi:hypothetical protein TorRG33x02_220180, partial [Trema orientale]
QNRIILECLLEVSLGVSSPEPLVPIVRTVVLAAVNRYLGPSLSHEVKKEVALKGSFNFKEGLNGHICSLTASAAP